MDYSVSTTHGGLPGLCCRSRICRINSSRRCRMRFPRSRSVGRRRRRLLSKWALPACFVLPLLAGCHRAATTIAVIPRTSGTMLWEPEHGGAQAVALKSGVQIYWNAPTREDDIANQIALVDKVVAGNYQGLVLSPDHALALITPVRRAMARGLPTVIVGSPLAIPPGNGLSYVLNDEEAGGGIVAQRIGALLNGQGTVALLGINPDILGIVTRARSLEQHLSVQFPNIHVVVTRTGSFNVPHEQQVAEETLKANPTLDAIVALTATSCRGVLSAISERHLSRVRVIGFDPDAMIFDSPNLDSLVLQDTKKMGAQAVLTVVGAVQGQRMPTVMRIEPTLVTRDNAASPEIKEMTSMDWRPAPMRWKWSVGP
jgi:ribose transport system substrate-binding protein